MGNSEIEVLSELLQVTDSVGRRAAGCKVTGDIAAGNQDVCGALQLQ